MITTVDVHVQLRELTHGASPVVPKSGLWAWKASVVTIDDKGTRECTEHEPELYETYPNPDFALEEGQSSCWNFFKTKYPAAQIEVEIAVDND